MNNFASVRQYYTYPEFVQFTEKLVAQGRTTGPDQSETMVDYTRLNLQRMRRWERTFQVSPALAAEAKTASGQTWWLITEPWCGDSAQSITQLAKIAEASLGHIDLKIILRDEHPAIMDKYLVAGARSVPRLVALDSEDHELFTWGPRPAGAQQIMLNWKEDPHGRTYDDIKKELHLWYARNKGENLQEEILRLLQQIPAESEYCRS